MSLHLEEKDHIKLDSYLTHLAVCSAGDHSPQSLPWTYPFLALEWISTHFKRQIEQCTLMIQSQDCTLVCKLADDVSTDLFLLKWKGANSSLTSKFGGWWKCYLCATKLVRPSHNTCNTGVPVHPELFLLRASPRNGVPSTTSKGGWQMTRIRLQCSIYQKKVTCIYKLCAGNKENPTCTRDLHKVEVTCTQVTCTATESKLPVYLQAVDQALITLQPATTKLYLIVGSELVFCHRHLASPGNHLPDMSWRHTLPASDTKVGENITMKLMHIHELTPNFVPVWDVCTQITTAFCTVIIYAKSCLGPGGEFLAEIWQITGTGFNWVWVYSQNFVLVLRMRILFKSNHCTAY